MSLKKFAIETLEIAQWNVLKAIFRLHPEDFYVEIKPSFNSINWILGHLTIQKDYYFNYLCQGSRIVGEVLRRHYYPPRDNVAEILDFPLSVKDLINLFLKVSDSSFNYLRNLPEKKFNDLPKHNKNNTETVSELIQRVSLHYLGHTGQIIWIKKHLGKGGSFVMGVKKKQRDDSIKKWLKWWNDNKENYSKKDRLTID